MWEKKTDSIKQDFLNDTKKNGRHTDVITKIIPMPKLQFVASASLDSRIILWDFEYKFKWAYDEHTRGIVSLAFNEALILLLSAGFDHEIFVYNPYIPTAIYRIQGHAYPLVGVEVIEGTNQIASVDTDGVVKIWDIRKFNCIQTYSIDSPNEKHQFNVESFTYIPKPLKLVMGGRSVLFCEYDKDYNPHFVDDSAAVCAEYLPQNLSLLTPTGNKVKVWNTLTGEVVKIFSGIT